MENKIKSLADLRKMKDDVQSKVNLRERSDNPESVVQIKVAMATCGIASGAKQTMDFLIQELDKRHIPAVVTQTGCMGYCFAEPTVEVKLPGKDPVVYGKVDTKKADEIIEKYIKNGELLEGIIPVNYQALEVK
ncbi:MAG: (2Fe-2S) ferredoxin domain-containing protein [Bacteroidales bacterium]|nr:(2Fe-2S) ferredoxin domain-containing protein [Bacteroidales bacterium]